MPGSRRPAASTRTAGSCLRPCIEDGNEVDLALGAQSRNQRRRSRRLAPGRANHGASANRNVRVAGIAQIVEERDQVALVQQGQFQLHGAHIEVDLAWLAGQGDQKLLGVDDIAYVQHLAAGADSLDGVYPVEPALLADDAKVAKAA